MNLNKFMMAGALAALMGMGAVGCNENDPIGPGTGTVATPSQLEAVSLSSSAVSIRWTASTTAGATYLVSYRKITPLGSTDTSSSVTTGTGITVSGNSATILGLTAGAYRFYVHAKSGTDMSNPVSIDWAPATRYAPSATLRMYEFASTSGSGLILDPTKGGPRNASVAQSSTDPANSIALAIFTGTGVPAGKFSIGPAYAFLGFRNANKFDSSSYISRSGYSVSKLDDLYLRTSLANLISADSGNVSAFDLPLTSTDGNGVAFLMRVGNNPTNYARVLVVADASGKLLRGTSPDRYVELEISYQPTPNVPYAKGVVRKETPVAFGSYVPNPLDK